MAPRRKFDLRFKESVLQFAEQHSGERAARHFNVDSKRIRYWRKQKQELLQADQQRARLSGGGRKKVNVELETQLSQWIRSMWDQRRPVTRQMMESVVLELFPSGSGERACVSSTAWLQRFLQRNHLTLRRRIRPAQTDPESLSEELVWFVDHISQMVSCMAISEDDIVVMDETVVWFDMASPSDPRHRPQNSLFTVVLAAKADGTKLKPFVVLRAAASEVAALRQQTSGAVVATSVSGWMDDALTADWLQCMLGRFSSTPQLLVWDSYRCHISAATAAELRRGYNIMTAVIPPGCTRYIHPPAVMWSQAFRQSLQDAFDRWRAGGAEEATAGGSLKDPAHRLLVHWAVTAWDGLDEDLIRDSFKVCGLSVRRDGSEDDHILCFRAGQPLAAGRETLRRWRQTSQESCRHLLEEDEEELFNNELVVFDEEEEEEESDHVSWLCFIHHALPSNGSDQMRIKEEQQEWSSSLDQEEPPEPPHIKEEQQEWSSSLDQEEPPEPPHIKEEQQEWSSSLDQEEPPEPPHIKEEQEELWSSQEGEQLGGLEEAEIKFTPVPVKSEEDEPETDDSADWTGTSRPETSPDWR